MRNVKTKVIPVIIGATGTISYSFRKYPSKIPGKHENKGATENSHTVRCTRTAASTDVKYKRFNMENSIIFVINCKHRITAIFCTLGIRVCSRYIIVNTFMKVMTAK
jgi:hypothetical protein